MNRPLIKSFSKVLSCVVMPVFLVACGGSTNPQDDPSAYFHESLRQIMVSESGQTTGDVKMSMEVLDEGQVETKMGLDMQFESLVSDESNYFFETDMRFDMESEEENGFMDVQNLSFVMQDMQKAYMRVDDFNVESDSTNQQKFSAGLKEAEEYFGVWYLFDMEDADKYRELMDISQAEWDQVFGDYSELYSPQQQELGLKLQEEMYEKMAEVEIFEDVELLGEEILEGREVYHLLADDINPEAIEEIVEVVLEFMMENSQELEDEVTAQLLQDDKFRSQMKDVIGIMLRMIDPEFSLWVDKETGEVRRLAMDMSIKYPSMFDAEILVVLDYDQLGEVIELEIPDSTVDGYIMMESIKEKLDESNFAPGVEDVFTL